jgi:hypothetical protein
LTGPDDDGDVDDDADAAAVEAALDPVADANIRREVIPPIRNTNCLCTNMILAQRTDAE